MLNPQFSSTKSMIGHSIGAAEAIEVVVCALSNSFGFGSSNVCFILAKEAL